jgi:glycosyltransferase involved in cell wall biosynthesis
VKILLLNWQDRLNPLAGGAETHLHEIFGRLAARGHEVTLLASGWPSAPARETVDGLEVYRIGSRYTYGMHVPRAARRLLERDRYDIVVEALNKVPTFAPRWAGCPVVLIVHHLFGTSAFQEAGVPVAAVTWLLERPLPRIYRNVPVQAISRSTEDDLVERGLRRQNIRVIYPGVDLDFFTPSSDQARAASPTFVYVGRLKRYKRVDLILRALARLDSRRDGIQLLIAGRGEWEPHLRRLTARLGLGPQVTFLGFVSEAEKRELFRRAWANVFVSPKEGWGITNLEAAACGTPTIASDSPGLRESVVPDHTGILVPHGDVVALAGAISRLAAGPALVESLGANALDFAGRFRWDAAADATEAHLLEVSGSAPPMASFSGMIPTPGANECDR